MLPSRPRRLAVLATVPLLALAGCSTDDGGDDASTESAATGAATTSAATEAPAPTETPADAGTATPGEGASSAPSDGETVDPAEFAQSIQAATKDSSGYRMTTEQDLGGQASTTDAKVDQRSDPPAVEMTVTGGMAPGDVQVRIVDDRVFLKGEGITPDGTWAGSEPGSDDPFGSLFRSMSQQFRTAGTPENFAEVATSVVRLGTEEVDGEQLEHYRVTIDGQAAMANLGDGMGQAGGAAGPSAQPSVPAPSIPASIEQDIYLDDQGRTRRVEQSLGQVTTTITISEWDATFDIAAPPEDQVTPFSELQGGAGLGGTPSEGATGGGTG